MAFDVFLSHSKADEALVTQLRDVASNLDCKLYVYTDDPQAGRNIFDKVKERISTADVVVVLLTEVSAASGAVQQEVGAALAFNKPIIPVKVKGLNHRSLGFLLDREWIELDDEDQGAGLAGIRRSLARYKKLAASQAIIIALFLAALVTWWIWKRGNTSD